jgi:hypothetical protein
MDTHFQSELLSTGSITETTQVLDDLIRAVLDGIAGLTNGAARASGAGHIDISSSFEKLAIHRQRLLDDLGLFGSEIGHDWNATVVTALIEEPTHRCRTEITDIAKGGVRDALLDAAETSETHTIVAYWYAISTVIPESFLALVRRQLAQVVKDLAEIRSLRQG